MRGNLDSILPRLLNPGKTALNENVIAAIGIDKYKIFKQNTNNDEQKIAKLFVSAVLISYGQRILDKYIKESAQNDELLSITNEAGILANMTTLNGLPKPSITRKELKNIVNEFCALMEQAPVPKDTSVDEINSALGSANMYLQGNAPGISVNADDSVVIHKTLEYYKKATEKLATYISNTLESKFPEPKEVHWFKKILRFIFRNEKLLQNEDEKNFEILNKFKCAKDKLNPPPADEKAASPSLKM